MEERLKKIKEILNKYNQIHLLKFYDEISDEEKKSLISQIENIDFELMKKVFEEKDNFKDFTSSEILPVESTDKEKLETFQKEEYERIGNKIIKQGEFAVITMAGGQGTRLGHSGPKGSFDLGLGNSKTLFEILSEDIKKKSQELQATIPWYIMTSDDNNEATIKFFEEKNYFNMGKENVYIFKQKTLPMLDEEGKVLLETKSKIKSGANGSGGVFESLLSSGYLEDMKKKGVKWVFIGAVDNVLLKMADSLFIGFAETSQTLAASKTIIKCSPDERVGVFCKRDGHPAVVEYTEISKEMANMRNLDGDLVFGDGHMLLNLYNIKALEKFATEKLPLHPAHKKANYIDSNGNLVEPNEPNAYKFETFIFDSFVVLDDIALLRVKREEEFAPVKNSEGNDSPETARKLYKDFWKI